MTETPCPPATDSLDSALEYAKAGLKIFPCTWVGPDGRCCCGKECTSPGKHPLISDFLNQATDDEARVRQWWTQWPNANIAMLTGRVNDIVVLDLDRHGDADGVTVAQERFGWEVEGPYQITGGDGIHAFYRHPGDRYIKSRTGSAAIAPGVELKGDGGFVIVPPSTHASGRRYQWKDGLLDVALPPLPEWAVPGESDPDQTGRKPFELPDVITKSNRNCTLTSYAGLLRRDGADLAQLEEQLQIANQQRCRPPLDDAEVLQIARSVARYPSPVEHGGQVAAVLMANAAKAPEAPNQPQKVQAAQWSPYPTDALPEPLHEYALQVSSALGVDPAFAALPTLAMIAAAIGTTRQAMPKRGWSEPCILWTGLIAESGSKKSPVMRAVLEPLRNADSLQIEIYRETLVRYEAEMAAYYARAKRTDDPEELPEAPVPPLQTRHVVSDVTPEALAKLLQDNPRGLLLDKDELSGWVGNFDRYRAQGGGEVAFWLSAWSAERAVSDRASKATIHVPRAAISIVGCIQPGILQRCFSAEHRENGLLPRMLLAMPEKKPFLWTDKTVDPELQRRVKLLVAVLLEELHFGPDNQPVTVELTPEAREEFIKWYDSLAFDITTESGTLASLLSKLHGYCLRLAAVLHFARWADERAGCGDGKPVSEAIDLDELSSAIELCEWHANEARRIMALLEPQVTANNKPEAELSALLNWIQSRGGSATPREVASGIRRYRGKAAEAKEQMERLVQNEYGRWETIKPDGPGRPSTRFVVSY